jgi:hypothetical protein
MMVIGVRAASHGPSRDEIERLSFSPRFPPREAGDDTAEGHVENHAEEEETE